MKRRPVFLISMLAFGFVFLYLPILLLIASNMFMTVAWYGHLRFPERSLAVVVLAS